MLSLIFALVPDEVQILILQNFDKSVDHKGLNHTFSGYGNILSCKIAKDFPGQSKQNCTSPGKLYIKQAKHYTPKATVSLNVKQRTKYHSYETYLLEIVDALT